MKKINNMAYRVSIISIILNILLSLIKICCGFIGHSQAIITDAIHSLTDLFSTFIVIIGIFFSGKKADKKHPYGHERFECVASIILANILIVTGIIIGYKGIISVVTNSLEAAKIPNMFALLAALVSIVTKEALYIYTKRVAKKINSSALMSDAYHHHSDALSSIGSLIGVGGAMLGYKKLDSIASIVIALFIIKAAYDILKESLEKMLDCSVDDEVENKILQIASSQRGVLSVDDLKTRQFGSKIYIDLEISVDGTIQLEKAHQIAHNVHDQIEETLAECKHCMIHVNPYTK